MDNVVTVLCSTALASVIVKLIDVWQKRKERKDTLQDRQTNTEKLSSEVKENSKAIVSIQDAVKLLIYDKFEYLASKALDKGSVTLKQYQVIQAFNQAYSSLGGDGWAEALMERVNELPIKEE